MRRIPERAETVSYSRITTVVRDKHTGVCKAQTSLVIGLCAMRSPTVWIRYLFASEHLILSLSSSNGEMAKWHYTCLLQMENGRMKR